MDGGNPIFITDMEVAFYFGAQHFGAERGYVRSVPVHHILGQIRTIVFCLFTSSFMGLDVS